jgi:hypothetical protein
MIPLRKVIFCEFESINIRRQTSHDATPSACLKTKGVQGQFMSMFSGPLAPSMGLAPFRRSPAQSVATMLRQPAPTYLCIQTA